MKKSPEHPQSATSVYYLHVAAAIKSSYFAITSRQKTMQKGGHVYILTNAHHNVFYTGVTSKLVNRTHQHKTHFHKNSFSDRYNVEFLVYYESYGEITEAISREKKVKKLSKERKISLINSINPEWRDLWEDIS